MSDLARRISASRRPLGKTGLDVFPIAYGMWRFAGTDVATARAKIEAALALGIDLFDTADVYGLDGGHPFGAAESLLGSVLRDAPGLRARMRLATKGGIVPGVPYDSSPRGLTAACEASLRRLGVEAIDLYQIHRPDLLAHPSDVAVTLARLRAQGKIHAVGVSNVTVAQVVALQAHLPFPIATSQPEVSPLHLDAIADGTLDLCLERGITPLAWSPLGGGRLGLSLEAALAKPDGERLAAVLRALDAIAVREGVPRTTVAYAWLLAHPAGIVPIVGTQQLERVREALRAFDVELSRADWYAILVAARGEQLP